MTMPSQVFTHLLRSLRGGGNTVTPQSLARQLLQLGHPILSAAQALDVLQVLGARGEYDYRYHHVVCSRVIDSWNLAGQHGIGHCYYGKLSDRDSATDLARLKHPSQQETLAAVCWAFLARRIAWDSDTARHWGSRDVSLGVSFDGENFWDQDMVKFVQNKVREQGLERAFLALARKAQ